MTKKIIFQDSFLISGIMCHQGCGVTIQGYLNICLDECKQANILPQSAHLIMDAEPQALGIHRIFITIESDDQEFKPTDERKTLLSNKLKESIDSIGFEVLDNNISNTPQDKLKRTNWINILVNLASITTIIILYFVFPPSILLTIGLTALSFLTTVFTARDYLLNFFRNLRNKNIANMITTISLGWLLSQVHTLYHSITMPLVSSFSMTFMSYIMPISLISLINGMDEIKRLVMNKAKKMHLQGTKTLFPQMAEEYQCGELSEAEQERLAKMGDAEKLNPDEFLQPIRDGLVGRELSLERKNSLKKGMVINIKRGECFPVDCILIQGNTLVDASLLTGESQQSKQCLDFIPAGAVNMGQFVSVYAIQDPYNSTVNKILFRSNRSKENKVAETNHKFSYFYTALVVIGVIAAIVTPLALGIFTIPLLLQNVTGILFGVCPCTVAIAHELPNLLSIYRRGNKGITLRDEQLSRESEGIQTVVFDKTGTLTTGNSQVESFDGISSSLWERIYLLEKHYGAEHPLAKAIYGYYEARMTHQCMIKDINKVDTDIQSRGLSALVQGKQIHIGNADYLQQSGIELPALNTQKIKQGFTAVYVAENNVYQGVIYIKHEVRKDILAALIRLKNEGKKIIMLTGDSKLSAIGFNQQNGNVFAEENIHAAQSPQDKETFMSQLMSEKDSNPKGVWFVGDGLNDAPCARVVTEKGGISCAMTSDAKAAFFADISLNGSLDYLFEHGNLNQFLKKNVLQNQALLSYGAIAFLAFILAFSIAGIAVSPIIPLVVMASTTLFVLFNSYRVQLAMDQALDKHTSWPKQLLASDVSLGLLVGASVLLMCGLIITTVATGGLAFPIITFTAGAVAAISSSCILAASALFGMFVTLAATHAVDGQGAYGGLDLAEHSQVNNVEPIVATVIPKQPEHHSSPLNFGFIQNQIDRKCINTIPNESDDFLIKSSPAVG